MVMVMRRCVCCHSSVWFNFWACLIVPLEKVIHKSRNPPLSNHITVVNAWTKLLK